MKHGRGAPTPPHACKPGKDLSDEHTHHPYFVCRFCGGAMKSYPTKRRPNKNAE